MTFDIKTLEFFLSYEGLHEVCPFVVIRITFLTLVLKKKSLHALTLWFLDLRLIILITISLPSCPMSGYLWGPNVGKGGMLSPQGMLVLSLEAPTILLIRLTSFVMSPLSKLCLISPSQSCPYDHFQCLCFFVGISNFTCDGNVQLNPRLL